MLTLDSVEFQYPGDSNRYHFSLQVETASISCISGRSGSGKSTLLDLIAGFQTPASGNIYWADQNLTTLPPDKRPVTTVFQRNNLFEHRNAIDNVVVGINPDIPKRGEEVDRAQQALESVGLKEFSNKKVSLLSGGQQQRVAIARAILRQSKIIMLDEPFSALDQQTRQDMLLLVQQLATVEQCAIVLVTHDLRDCESVADKHYDLRDRQLHLAVKMLTN